MIDRHEYHDEAAEGVYGGEAASRRRVPFVVVGALSVPVWFDERTARLGRDIEFLDGIRVSRVEARRVVGQVFGDVEFRLADAFNDALGELIASVIVVVSLVIVGECFWQVLRDQLLRIESCSSR